MTKDFKNAPATNNHPANAYLSNAPEPQQTQKTQPTQKAPKERINLNLKPGSIEYLQIMARLDGMSVTAYINKLIAADRKDRAEEFYKAKEFLNKTQ